MKRYKRHNVKVEKPEPSTSNSRHEVEYDLTYYIHDRVELMHQVFSVLKHKELRSIAPECVRHISIDDLQELCTEELLGISSKRLCAILDGADPPSDTESSSESPERMETISLDSISSDEEILSETSKKSKKHKRHRRDSKTKSKKKKSKEPEAENPVEVDKSRASRAGLTVLELLELQARARAIRAQLQQEQARKQAAEPTPSSQHSSDNEVEIKEEPAEVVEISSEDEKPNIEELRDKATSKPKEKSTPKSKEKTTEPEKSSNDTANTQTVTKRINENNESEVQNNSIKANKTIDAAKDTNQANKEVIDKITKHNGEKTKDKDQKSKEKLSKSKEREVKAKEKRKKQKKVKNTTPDSDHDEITLQLSDTEKMDLLEDLDRKNFDKLSSSSEDSESSSSESDTQGSDDESVKKTQDNEEESPNKNNVSNQITGDTKKQEDTSIVVNNVDNLDNTVSTGKDESVEKSDEGDMISSDNKQQEEPTMTVDKVIESQELKQNDGNTSKESMKPITEDNSEANDNIEITSIKDLPVVEDESVSVPSSPVVEIGVRSESPKATDVLNSPKNDTNIVVTSPDKDKRKEKSMSPDKDIHKEKTQVKSKQDSIDKSSEKETLRISVSSNSDKLRTVQIENIDSNSQETDKNLSEGELSDKESTDIEAVDVQLEVVCISDDESEKKSHKKKKKKEKKSKSKKSKKSKQDFREGGDQNFFKEAEIIENEQLVENIDKVKAIDENLKSKVDKVVESKEELICLEDDVCDDEILELSDDSSCYEVEGTVLSKEPTAEEIEALSAKIDEIERDDIVTEEEIREYESRNTENAEELENVSWKDRYLESNKVKKVLTTSSIFNALRKKNRELKRKIEESKKQQAVQEVEREPIVETNMPIEEGSIEQYKTLEGSTKYVDPVTEIDKTDLVVDNDAKNDGNLIENVVKNSDESKVEEANGVAQIAGSVETPQVGKEIRKDAKQLLKMYKRLMKYNDMNKTNPNKQKDPNKKKKKKSKKKNKDGVSASNL